jgi:hypothetical protein
MSIYRRQVFYDPTEKGTPSEAVLWQLVDPWDLQQKVRHWQNVLTRRLTHRTRGEILTLAVGLALRLAATEAMVSHKLCNRYLSGGRSEHNLVAYRHPDNWHHGTGIARKKRRATTINVMKTRHSWGADTPYWEKVRTGAVVPKKEHKRGDRFPAR